MFSEDNQSEDLKAFEAELAALRPRSDGLNPRWRFLLAQEAAFNQNLSGDDALAAGQYICSRCGATSSRSHRWAWPAAFSAMTTVAAALLVALVLRPEPQIARQIDKPNTKPATTLRAEKQTEPAVWLAVGNLPQRRIATGADEAAYLNVRDQVLRCGVDSWEPPPSATATAALSGERPLSYREQLDRLLKQESAHGS
jgi:hypothetical protein